MQGWRRAPWLRLLPAEPAPMSRGAARRGNIGDLGLRKQGYEEQSCHQRPLRRNRLKSPAACRGAGLYLAATQVQAAREGRRRVSHRSARHRAVPKGTEQGPASSSELWETRHKELSLWGMGLQGKGRHGEGVIPQAAVGCQK